MEMFARVRISGTLFERERTNDREPSSAAVPPSVPSRFANVAAQQRKQLA
jgi:hypothetical protein